MLKIVVSSWIIDNFDIMLGLSLFLITFLALKSAFLKLILLLSLSFN